VGREDLRVAIAVAQQRNAIDDYHVTRIGQLERSLANRRLVEQAKWLLVQNQGMSEPEAHERLQKIARDRRARLAEVAQIVIDTGRLPH
jgi:response regulator NasT